MEKEGQDKVARLDKESVSRISMGAVMVTIWIAVAIIGTAGAVAGGVIATFVVGAVW